MDGCLIRTVIALYTDDCTVVRTDAGRSERFKMKAGLHQELVLSPLLFAAVLSCELMYADDLVSMTPTIEKHGRRVAEEQAFLTND